MDASMTLDLAEDRPQGLLIWHKPQIQLLVVTLDTGDAPESGGDLETHGLFFISDGRVKQDIGTLVDPLARVLSLRGVTFRYDTANYPELGLHDQPQIGFLAQELEQVYPQAVTTRKDGFKAVNYALLVPVLVEAIKQQQGMITDLQDQIRDLR